MAVEARKSAEIIFDCMCVVEIIFCGPFPYIFGWLALWLVRFTQHLMLSGFCGFCSIHNSYFIFFSSKSMYALERVTPVLSALLLCSICNIAFLC